VVFYLTLTFSRSTLLKIQPKHESKMIINISEIFPPLAVTDEHLEAIFQRYALDRYARAVVRILIKDARSQDEGWHWSTLIRESVSKAIHGNSLPFNKEMTSPASPYEHY